MTREELEFDIGDFLKKHGKSLERFGSAELGMSKDRAAIFLEILHKKNMSPFGVEVWRRNGGRYDLDSLAGWYSVESGVEDNFRDVYSFIKKH